MSGASRATATGAAPRPGAPACLHRLSPPALRGTGSPGVVCTPVSSHLCPLRPAAVGGAAVGRAAVGRAAVGRAAVGGAAVGGAAVGGAAVGGAAVAGAGSPGGAGAVDVPGLAALTGRRAQAAHQARELCRETLPGAAPR